MRVLKKLGLSLMGIFVGLANLQAQKFGYIDSEYIMALMPEYKSAAENLDKLTVEYTQSIKTKHDEVNLLKEKYVQEEILYTSELKKQKMEELQKKEIELKEINNSIFGVNGLLFQKKKEILKPILQEIYKTSEKVAKKYKLNFIFDKASDLSIIFADPRHDYTDFILEELGLTN